jgi:hypothetical protein
VYEEIASPACLPRFTLLRSELPACQIDLYCSCHGTNQAVLRYRVLGECPYPAFIKAAWKQVSPYTYFAYVVIKRYERYWNIQQLELHPVFLGGLFQAANHHGPLENEIKGRYMRQDHKLVKEYYKFDYELPVPFPQLTINAVRFLRTLKEVKPAALEPATARFWVSRRPL